MLKVYGVIDPVTGIIIAFRENGYRRAKRHLGRLRRLHAGEDDNLRWMTAEERVIYARCLEWD